MLVSRGPRVSVRPGTAPRVAARKAGTQACVSLASSFLQGSHVNKVLTFKGQNKSIMCLNRQRFLILILAAVHFRGMPPRRPQSFAFAHRTKDPLINVGEKTDIDAGKS